MEISAIKGGGGGATVIIILCEENEKWSSVHLSNIDCVIN